MIELEREVERYLVRRVEALGGRCLKWTSPGTTGLPDRIVLLPRGRIIFVELKRPKGSRVAPLQIYWREALRGLGFPAYVTHTRHAIDAMLSLEADKYESERPIHGSRRGRRSRRPPHGPAQPGQA